MFARLFRPDPFTGWHMVAVIGLFFGTIITVNLIMATFAVQSWTGLIVRNPYVAAQGFDQRTATRLAERAQGWSLAGGIAPEGLAFSLADADGAAITDAAIVLSIGRPAHEHEDQVLTLAADGNAGIYTSDVVLAPGVWAGEVAIARPDGSGWTTAIRLVAEGGVR